MTRRAWFLRRAELFAWNARRWRALGYNWSAREAQARAELAAWHAAQAPE